MFDTIRQFSDRVLGRGDAAITVPVMDGALKPNRVLDDAEVVATLPDIDDLATDGTMLFATAGAVLYRLDAGRLVEVQRFDADITALAVRSADRLAVALAGKRIVLMSSDRKRPGNLIEIATLDRLGDAPLHSVNALSFEADDSVLFSDGSTRRGPDDWCRDLMEKGQTGRVARWRVGLGAGTNSGPGTVELLASRLQYAYGVLPRTEAVADRQVKAGGVRYSESWRHRVVQAGLQAGSQPVLADLPGYPSRMAPAARGGFWLTCFVCRTQLVEFVLREDAYRTRMLESVDPRYWVAPSLRSGTSYLEPLQGAGVKQMGVLKPWAPPRSYGLVLHVDAQGHTTESLHSQVDGQHHGITAVVEFGGALYAASRGSGRLLRVPLTGPGAMQ
ncbi:strictosidine synthase [Variovorax sp. LG9.2]|jgi:hypothetical protein|uniref:strictosidine synthase n=1 Tax=Variovorax sp. LG9.2 TaxID=3048626 RepID=UPI002B2277B7|nr:strictosidine synthase [Variovorax sp. LG9.2]MEB0055836.1 strictosidine synthase [Variovorax sp. LG9.2]